MCNELDQKSKSALQTMMNVEVLPVTPEVDLEMHNATKVRLADLSALGVAFQPLTAAVQTLVTGHLLCGHNGETDVSCQRQRRLYWRIDVP